MPHLVLLTVDNPPGANDGWFRVLDAMTDLDMAPEMGVWRLLENDAQVNPVHAALLHTGSVLFFAGSGNDMDRHHDCSSRRRSGTTRSRLQPPRHAGRPVLLRARVPAGRPVARKRGTEQYDPFFGLKQAVAFDRVRRPGRPGEPDGSVGAWTLEPDMAGGRWYPTLRHAAGRSRACRVRPGRTQPAQRRPGDVRDGGGLGPHAASPSNWPMYGHLFLLADGRLFYSGGQYGANNGVRPSIWDLARTPPPRSTASSSTPGSATRPPASCCRRRRTSGSCSSVAGRPTCTTRPARPTRPRSPTCPCPNPTVTMAAPMAMRRMHLCATLLPDRTVLVNGGSMMEESAADATLEAEIYHPDVGGGPGRWAMAATSRVARLYHSVALADAGRQGDHGRAPTRRARPRSCASRSSGRRTCSPGPRPTCTPSATEVHYGAADRRRAGCRPDRVGLPDAARRHHPLHATPSSGSSTSRTRSAARTS